MHKRLISILCILAFLGAEVRAYAQSVLTLPVPGTRVSLSSVFTPPLLKGIKVYRNDPFRFDFILDQGDVNEGDPAGRPYNTIVKQNGHVFAMGQDGRRGDPLGRPNDIASVETQNFASLRNDSNRLIKYFLAALTIPEKDLWVNLSPYEKDRIVPESFGQTEMGRDLLAQDYLLKQITASVIYPEGEVGKAFWAKVYAKAQEKYGTIDIPVDTFNKVWIVPEKAEVYEHDQAAYVTQAHLKVMLETDYLAANQNTTMNVGALHATPLQSDLSHEMTKSVLREIIIPILEKEVNEGANFAQLRQVYYSLILATWYKRKIVGALHATPLQPPNNPMEYYIDHQKIAGVGYRRDEALPRLYNTPEQIWAQYVEAFKKGAYNFVKEEYDSKTQVIVPRKYFSGGAVFKMDVFRIEQNDNKLDEMNLDHAMRVTVDMNLFKDSAMRALFNRDSLPMLLTLAARVFGNHENEIYHVYVDFLNEVHEVMAASILSVGYALQQRNKPIDGSSFYKARTLRDYQKVNKFLVEYYEKNPRAQTEPPSAMEVAQVAAWIAVAAVSSSVRFDDVVSMYKQLEQSSYNIHGAGNEIRMFSILEAALLLAAICQSGKNKDQVLRELWQNYNEENGLDGRASMLSSVMIVLAFSLVQRPLSSITKTAYLKAVHEGQRQKSGYNFFDIHFLGIAALLRNQEFRRLIGAMEEKDWSKVADLEKEYAVELSNSSVKESLSVYKFFYDLKLDPALNDGRNMYDKVILYFDSKSQYENRVSFGVATGRKPGFGVEDEFNGFLSVVKVSERSAWGYPGDLEFYVDSQLQYILRPTGILIDGLSIPYKYQEKSYDDKYFNRYVEIIQNAIRGVPNLNALEVLSENSGFEMSKRVMDALITKLAEIVAESVHVDDKRKTVEVSENDIGRMIRVMAVLKKSFEDSVGLISNGRGAFLHHIVMNTFQKLVSAIRNFEAIEGEFQIKRKRNLVFRELRFLIEVFGAYAMLPQIHQEYAGQPKEEVYSWDAGNPEDVSRIIKQILIEAADAKDERYWQIVASRASGYKEVLVTALEQIQEIFSDAAQGQEAVSLNDVFSRLETNYPGQLKITGLDEKLLVSSTDQSVSPDSLYDMFFELINNALDAQRGRGPVDVTIEPIDDYIRISVSDHGRGINYEDLRNKALEYARQGELILFRAGTKIDSKGANFPVDRIMYTGRDYDGFHFIAKDKDCGSRLTVDDVRHISNEKLLWIFGLTTKTSPIFNNNGGFGAGLEYVKLLVDRMNGYVHVNTGPKGTTFVVTLPKFEQRLSRKKLVQAVEGIGAGGTKDMPYGSGGRTIREIYDDFRNEGRLAQYAYPTQWPMFSKNQEIARRNIDSGKLLFLIQLMGMAENQEQEISNIYTGLDLNQLADEMRGLIRGDVIESAQPLLEEKNIFTAFLDHLASGNGYQMAHYLATPLAKIKMLFDFVELEDEDGIDEARKIAFEKRLEGVVKYKCLMRELAKRSDRASIDITGSSLIDVSKDGKQIFMQTYLKLIEADNLMVKFCYEFPMEHPIREVYQHIIGNLLFKGMAMDPDLVDFAKRKKPESWSSSIKMFQEDIKKLDQYLDLLTKTTNTQEFTPESEHDKKVAALLASSDFMTDPRMKKEFVGIREIYIKYRNLFIQRYGLEIPLKDLGVVASEGSGSDIIKGTGDAAQVSNTGGIDLNPAKIDIKNKDNGKAVRFDIDPAKLKQLQDASGVVPVIINIQPMTDLKMFLGLNEPEKNQVMVGQS